MPDISEFSDVVHECEYKYITLCELFADHECPVFLGDILMSPVPYRKRAMITNVRLLILGIVDREFKKLANISMISD